MNLPPTRSHLHRLPPLQHHQRPIQRLFAIPPPLHKLPPQRRQTRTPPNRQPPPQLLLHLRNLLHQLLAALALALRDGVHGRGEEEADGFVDVGFGGDGGEGQFGEGFGDADDGFELAHGDGDGGAGVGGEFGAVDLAADGDEVGGELFGGGGGEAGGAAAGLGLEVLCCSAYEVGERGLRFAVADVSLHSFDRNLGFGLVFDTSSAHLDAHYVSGDPFVSAFLVLVTDDEDHVETGQDCGLEINVFSWCLEIVVSAENGIGRSKH